MERERERWNIEKASFDELLDNVYFSFEREREKKREREIWNIDKASFDELLDNVYFSF